MARNGSRMVASPRESLQMNPTMVPERLRPVPWPKTQQKRAETSKSADPDRRSRVRLLRTCSRRWCPCSNRTPPSVLDIHGLPEASHCCKGAQSPALHQWPKSSTKVLCIVVWNLHRLPAQCKATKEELDCWRKVPPKLA